MARRLTKKALKILRSRRGTSLHPDDLRSVATAGVLGAGLFATGFLPIASKGLRKVGKAYKQSRVLGNVKLKKGSYWRSKVHAGAPGVDIMSTLPRRGSVMGARYGKASGSSQATAVVSGDAVKYVNKFFRSDISIKKAYKEGGPNLRKFIRRLDKVHGKKSVAELRKISPQLKKERLSAVLKDYRAKALAPGKNPRTKTVPTYLKKKMGPQYPFKAQKDIRSYVIPGTSGYKKQLSNYYKRPTKLTKTDLKKFREYTRRRYGSSK